MKGICFVILFLQALTCSPLHAQLVREHTVYFQSGSAKPDLRNIRQLDSIVAALPNIPGAYIVYVSGHTDNKGSLTLNNNLSKNRASEVLRYLRSKGFKSVDSTLSYHAYLQPIVNNTEDQMWQNRRVNIRIFQRRLNMVKILGVKDFAPRVYKLIEDEGGTLRFDSTTIVIKPNAFRHQNGSEVSGEIDVSYQEYRNPADFILSGVSMSVVEDNKLHPFNSAGMFKISASQNGEELILKKEKQNGISVKMLLTDLSDQRFYSFDSISQQWAGHPGQITDPHQHILPPFNGQNTVVNMSGKSGTDNLYYDLCAFEDTCRYIKGMITKLNYFASHPEPINQQYPYKFVKNNLVDFKSTYYRVQHDTTNGLITFASVNGNNHLGPFKDYQWSYDKQMKQGVKKGDIPAGSCFVKVVYKGSNKFQVLLESRVFEFTGQPANTNYGDTRLKRLNKKNYKRYLKYTYGLDQKEKAMEEELMSKLEINREEMRSIYKDSLICLQKFYSYFVSDLKNEKYQALESFNIDRAPLTEKLKRFNETYDCKKLKYKIWQADSARKAYQATLIAAQARQDSSLNVRKNAFASFGLAYTGMYNADAVKRIAKPQEIFATYSVNGKPAHIVAIYLSLPGINGIMKYDGYAGYNPSHFVFETGARSMLIAVDTEDKSYYCTPQEFSDFLTAAGNTNVHINLKPLTNLKNAADLATLVAEK